ncbi:MAG TPA: hypothetical protein GX693_01110 [Firmicutes bacterium]|nr:hypothetical protein [Bacillota bacterium]
MKTEINLRTREFVVSREFYWPRLAVTVAGVVLLFAAAVGSVLIYIYVYNLKHELVYLAGREEELQIKAAPVIELEQAINRVKQDAVLEKELRQSITPWSAYLREIKEAAGEGVRVTQVAASADGKMSITGQGATLRDIAVYIQSLKTLDYLSQVTIGYINLEQGERLGFALSATSSTGGGLESNEQAQTVSNH